ncbi:MAG: hypothetical protein ABSC37_19355, partial [Xanthobacteraceae bacterium]
MSFHQSLETDQSIETHESAPKIKRSYHHRESPIERFARRTEIAPLDPAKNIAFVAAARRYRQHWLYRDGSNYHDREFVAAQAALAAYSKNVLRMVEFVVLDELSV